MARLRRIGKYIVYLTGAGLVATLVQGFSLTNWINLSFLIALFSLVISGFYYLKCQNAYHSLGNSMKKFLYAIVELFGGKDHTEQRKAMDNYAGAGENIAHGCEAFVASAVLLAVDVLLSYAIF